MTPLTIALAGVMALAIAVAAVAVWVAGDALRQRDLALADRDRAFEDRRVWQRRCLRQTPALPPPRLVAGGPLPLPAPVTVPAGTTVRPLPTLPTAWPDPPRLHLPPLDPVALDDLTAEGELLPVLPDGMPRTDGPGHPTPDLHTHPPAPVIPVPPADRRTLPLIGTRT